MSAGPDIHGMVNDQQFQGLPPRDQRRALYQLTNDSSFQGLSDADTMRFVGTMRTQTQAPTVAPTAALAQPQPGFTQRLGQSLGIPTSTDELQAAGQAAMKPQLADILGPMGRPIVNYAQTAGRGLIEAGKESYAAGQGVGSGDISPKQGLGKAGYAAMHGIAQSTPFIGPSVETAGQDVQQGNVPGAAGGLTGVIAQILAPELIKRGAGVELPSKGDMGAKASAMGKLLKQEAIAKIPIAGRVVRRPSFMDYAEALAQKADPQMELFKNVPKLGDFPSAKADVETGLPKAEAKSVPENPTVAYRVRDAGETGIMPKGHAQAGLDMDTVSSYAEGRAQANNAAQELVKIDLTKLDSSEYSVHPNGYVTFKTAVPESYIEKIKVTTRNVTQAGNLQRSNLAKNQKQMAKYGIKVPEK